jgi:hypothetical protein
MIIQIREAISNWMKVVIRLFLFFVTGIEFKRYFQMPQRISFSLWGINFISACQAPLACKVALIWRRRLWSIRNRIVAGFR